MKSLLFVFLSFFGLYTTAPAQAPVALDDICRAIGASNVDQIAAAMDAEVELSLLDQENVYTREQAKAALTAFFKDFTSVSFGKVHQGASKSEDAEYCIGTLTTNKGAFRVYVYGAKKGNGILLQELRIDRN
ncbi:DUF4783 domain-containing protein [Neolewinella lacunae]|uniref:DUF4783 domain-containing protein n=1 Tax=Neolewinella lacunae TaxID=1517758 RepID=A0A923PN96_9BACT|nr:DUF4783 domain-containing protein [Neolewinella lacunae]MBC6994429.1 DUF4783 domain-containing protein [Neolewinella lacunae]MDN3633365.1 DUF4783 domain-containing protein [Neolewinella lacunae]